MKFLVTNLLLLMKQTGAFVTHTTHDSMSRTKLFEKMQLNKNYSTLKKTASENDIYLQKIGAKNIATKQDADKYLREKIKSPADLGSPIPERVKSINSWAIGFIKNTVFDTIYAGNDLKSCYTRFYALETIARVPYFSYLSVLHLYETLGWWRRAKYLKLHFAESWNELHHLLIMEELLEGEMSFFDQFFAQNIALVYYLFVFLAYAFNPVLAYNLNQAVEEHAYDTYNKFLIEYGSELEKLPAPSVATKYYLSNDRYLFDEMHTFINKANNCDIPFRRPKCDNLYDTFTNIRDDEAEHVNTMKALQEMETELMSINESDELCELDEE